MEKRIFYLAVSLMIFAFSPAHAFELTYEAGVDRPGCDFEQFEVPNPPGVPGIVCQNACGRDPSCQAWNFDPVHFQGKLMCFLKSCAAPPQSSVGVTGGVKLPFTMSTAETNVDRPGCDIQNFEARDLGICSNACGSNSNCEAWNFDPVHFQGKLMCFLKSCAAPPQSSVGVTGGVKFHPGAE